MLSNRLYLTLRIVIPVFVFFGIAKYTWIPQQKQFIKVSINNMLIRFNVLFLVTWIFFLVFQILRFKASNKLGILIFLIVLLSALGLVALCFLLSIRWADQQILTSNYFLTFFIHINGNIV